MLTLHEAQAKIAAVYRREGWGEQRIDWSDPLGEALAAHIQCRSAPPLTRRAIAWSEICTALLAYHEHVVHTAGQKAATDAILAYADSEAKALAGSTDETDRDGALALTNLCREIRDGFHLAEKG